MNEEWINEVLSQYIPEQQKALKEIANETAQAINGNALEVLLSLIRVLEYDFPVQSALDLTMEFGKTSPINFTVGQQYNETLTGEDESQ